MDRFEQVFTKLCDSLALYVSSFLALIMMLYLFGNVLFRYLLGLGGIIGCYSFVGALLIPLVYLGLAYGWYKRGYIVLDIFQQRLKGKTLWGFQFAFLLLTLCFFSAMFYGACLDTVFTYNHGNLIGEPGYLTVPKWPWEATIIIGTLLMAIRNILDMIAMVRTGEVISADR